LTHGMVLDASGKKMSKSLGNIISPMTIVRGGTVGRQYLLFFAPVKDRLRVRNSLRMVPTHFVYGLRQ
jgi:isoleucyl-tRNA synthetase